MNIWLKTSNAKEEGSRDTSISDACLERWRVEDIRKGNVIVAEKKIHNVQSKVWIWVKGCRLIQLGQAQTGILFLC
jgi:hypothetical protein